MTYDDDLDLLLDRATPPPRPAFLDQPVATWDREPAVAVLPDEYRLERAKTSGRHRAPRPCRHHPQVWATLWIVGVAVGYVLGAWIGLPS